MRSPDDVPARSHEPDAPSTSAAATGDDARVIDGMLTRRSPHIVERLLQQGRVADAVQRAQREQLPEASAIFTRVSRQYLRTSRPRLARALAEATGSPPQADVLRLYAALYRAEGEDDAAAELDAWLNGA
ncbi:MAG TPA: hypothetical protein VFN10_19335 [Thermoanaerobaculia bacterium]|nr:hypothetical protein [Thermoanaerobaculia bacterium]